MFLTFFENPKKHDFLRFLEMLHTFSRTLPCSVFRHLLYDVSFSLQQYDRLKLKTANVMDSDRGQSDRLAGRLVCAWAMRICLPLPFVVDGHDIDFYHPRRRQSAARSTDHRSRTQHNYRSAAEVCGFWKFGVMIAHNSIVENDPFCIANKNNIVFDNELYSYCRHACLAVCHALVFW